MPRPIIARVVRFVALALLVVTSTARATPLEPLWEVRYPGSCDSAVLTLDGKLQLLHDRTLTPVDPATGKLGKPRRLQGTRKNEQHGRSWGSPLGNAELVDGVIVVDGGGWVGGHDAATGKQLWLRAPEVGGAPRVRAAGAMVIAEHAAQLGPGDPGVVIELFDPHTNQARWTTTLPTSRGQLMHEALDAHTLYVYTALAYGSPRAFVTAVALATGAPRWSAEVVAPAGQTTGITDVAISDAGLIVVVPGEGLRVLDAATGQERRRIALTPSSLAVHGARLYAALDREVVALDVATGARAWSAPIGRAQLDSDGAFLFASDGDDVHALDLATGADLARWGIAGQDLIHVRAGAGAPMLVLCGGGRLTALDPGAPVRPVEHATITGAVTCVGCSPELPPARVVQVGGAEHALVRGRFRATVEGRGHVAISAEPADMRAFLDSATYTLELCQRVVALTGRGRYTVDCQIRVGRSPR